MSLIVYTAVHNTPSIFMPNMIATSFVPTSPISQLCSNA